MGLAATSLVLWLDKWSLFELLWVAVITIILETLALVRPVELRSKWFIDKIISWFHNADCTWGSIIVLVAIWRWKCAFMLVFLIGIYLGGHLLLTLYIQFIFIIFICRHFFLVGLLFVDDSISIILLKINVLIICTDLLRHIQYVAFISLGPLSLFELVFVILTQHLGLLCWVGRDLRLFAIVKWRLVLMVHCCDHLSTYERLRDFGFRLIYNRIYFRLSCLDLLNTFAECTLNVVVR